jgi:hypothetical protein
LIYFVTPRTVGCGVKRLPVLLVAMLSLAAIFDAGFEFSILHYQFSIPKVESAACKFTWF